MFRSAKVVFQVLVLAFTYYAVEIHQISPQFAMVWAAALIVGPEGVEAYLVRQGVIAERDGGE